VVDIFSQNFGIQVRRVAHHGCVNRIRAMPQNSHICVSWADSGHVQVRLYFCLLSQLGCLFLYVSLLMWISFCVS